MYKQKDVSIKSPSEVEFERPPEVGYKRPSEVGYDRPSEVGRLDNQKNDIFVLKGITDDSLIKPSEEGSNCPGKYI